MGTAVRPDGAAWESNPPSAGLRRLTGFEALLGAPGDAAWLLRLHGCCVGCAPRCAPVPLPLRSVAGRSAASEPIVVSENGATTMPRITSAVRHRNPVERRLRPRALVEAHGSTTNQVSPAMPRARRARARSGPRHLEGRGLLHLSLGVMLQSPQNPYVTQDRFPIRECRPCVETGRQVLSPSTLLGEE
jgi:hypothetical protein